MAKAISEMTLDELKQRKTQLEKLIESATDPEGKVDKGFNFMAANNDLSQINMEIARKTEKGGKSGAN